MAASRPATCLRCWLPALPGQARRSTSRYWPAPRSRAARSARCAPAWNCSRWPSGRAMAAERLDWPALMRLGLGVLRLAPADFWAMTPGELRLAAEGAGLVVPAGIGPMGRGRLAELMAAFPDVAARAAPP